MPNWCENRVRIYDEDGVEKLVEFVKGEDSEFDFQKILPMPEALDGIVAAGEGNEYRYEIPPKKGELMGKGQIPVGPKERATLLKLYGATNWYNWCNKNWGTKWNAREVRLECDDEYDATFRFDTAWCPPKPISNKLRELFPDASISWFWDEPGMEQAGYI